LINNNAMIKRESNDTVRLCCGKAGCPTIKDLGDGYVEITDDDGATIKVKKAEAELISDGLKVLDGKQVICG
jgi:hypothetical protein